MRFAFPEYGWWMILLLIVLIALVIIFGRANQHLLAWFRKNEFTFHLPWVKLILRGLGTGFLGVALLGPYWGRREQKVNVLGREIYFLLDVSASMNAEDLKPSRLEKAKQDLKRMVQELKGDKMGLIVFTSHAYVQAPLTNDVSLLLMFIDLVKSDQFANTGTDFRVALLRAFERFDEVEKAQGKVSRAIVLISDGENFGEEYQSVVDRLKEANIQLYCVGIGTPTGAMVPNLVYGKKNGYKQNPDGTSAISKLEDESLKALADEFGTLYQPIDQQIKDLKPVTEQVKLQSAALMDTRTEQVNNNRFQWFLLPAILMLAISMWLMPFKRNAS